MGKTYLVLHKTEWERLHRKTDDTKPLSDQRDVYFKKLIEKSQSWIKTWPDTVQGHVEQIAKQKEKRHEEEIAMVKKGLKLKKHENTKEAIKRAREMIFDDSSYGRQLLSALMESKTLETRDIQMKFQKELHEQAKRHDQEMISKLKLDQCSFGLDDKEKELEEQKRKIEQELAEINKSMHEMKINRTLKSKIEQNKKERENAHITKTMLIKEAQKEKEYDATLKRDVEHYNKEHQLAKERRAQREKSDQQAADAQRNELEAKNCKINKVFKQIHEKQDTEQFKRNFETVKEIQEQKNIVYKDFVQKGVTELEERITQKEKEYAAKQKYDREKSKTFAKTNMLVAEQAIQMRSAEKHLSKCVGDRQCILTKSCWKPKTKRADEIKEDHRLSFLSASNKLREELECRRAQPPAWNATSAAHAQFAQRAADTLKDCRHKRFARKVVDEYRRLNGLDSKTLPVPNY